MNSSNRTNLPALIDFYSLYSHRFFPFLISLPLSTHSSLSFYLSLFTSKRILPYSVFRSEFRARRVYSFLFSQVYLSSIYISSTRVIWLPSRCILSFSSIFRFWQFHL